MKYLLSLFFLLYSISSFCQADSTEQFNVDSMLQAEFTNLQELMHVTDKDRSTLKKMLKRQPNSGETQSFYYMIGYRYFVTDSIARAETIMNDIIKRYQGRCVYGEAVVTLGEIAAKKHDTAKAINILENYVSDKKMDLLKCEIGESGMLFGDPNISSKNRACYALVGIFRAKKNYYKTIAYMDLIRDKYPSYEFCGNGAFATAMTTFDDYYEVYMCLKDTAAAIRALLPMIQYDASPFFFAGHYENLHTLLHSKYPANEIEQEVKQALNTIEIGKDIDDAYRTIYVTLFGHRFILREHNKYDYKTNMRVPEVVMLEASRKFYSESTFYKQIYKPQLNKALD